jgi:predicted short-subunit dehydrogenase-like oxidoreductase (DUF2520 family)
MARHMRHYLDLLGLAHRSWSRDSKVSLPPDQWLSECPVILILVSDDAIHSVAGTFSPQGVSSLVHFSGRVVTPLAAGMHPLSTFGDDLYNAEVYRTIPFITERGGIPFGTAFPSLPNPHHAIDPALKPLYHTLAVLAGNFTTAVWHKLFTTFEERLALPRDVAIPYLHQIARNVERSADRALTGPIPRRDRETIADNLAALEGDPYRDVYEAFVRAMAPDLLPESP